MQFNQRWLCVLFQTLIQQTQVINSVSHFFVADLINDNAEVPRGKRAHWYFITVWNKFCNYFVNFVISLIDIFIWAVCYQINWLYQTRMTMHCRNKCRKSDFFFISGLYFTFQDEVIWVSIDVNDYSVAHWLRDSLTIWQENYY